MGGCGSFDPSDRKRLECGGLKCSGVTLKFERGVVASAEQRKPLSETLTEKLASSLIILGERERPHNEGEQQRHDPDGKDQHCKWTRYAWSSAMEEGGRAKVVARWLWWKVGGRRRDWVAQECL